MKQSDKTLKQILKIKQAIDDKNSNTEQRITYATQARDLQNAEIIYNMKIEV